jgi:hypothetical protein
MEEAHQVLLMNQTQNLLPEELRSLTDIYNSCHVAFFSGESQNFKEAVRKEEWRKAMNEEMISIEKNQIWKLVDLPKEKKAVGLKWVFKIKYNEYGSIQKHKGRIVAKGYSQQPGVDFTETFALVARMETIRIVLVLSAQLQLQVFQLVVKSAFLDDELQEEVYVQQPPGYELKGKEDKVYRLHKALYGLKQAPRAWNHKIDLYLHQNGFSRSQSEPSLYIKKKGEDFLMVCLYVDDLIYTGTSKDMVAEFKTAMMKEFEMPDLGLMRYFLGIQAKQFPGKIFISQEKYVADLLTKFHMSECKLVASLMAANEKLLQDDGATKIDSKYFRSLVGSLIYLTNSRPNILYFVSIISRFMENPDKLHLEAAMRILQYLQGTKNHGILYKQQDENRLIGYSDGD